MAKPHERVFALVTAILFLATTVATGALVVWQIRKDNQDRKSATNSIPPASLNNQSQEKKLEGTKLSGFTPVAKVNQLQTTDLQAGTGAEAKPTSTIVFHYTGALSKDGTIFQSSHDTGQPATFALSDLIPGWQQGIPGMKAGGKRRLLIPAALAYGPQENVGHSGQLGSGV